MVVYLDCNATTPIEPPVREVVMRFMADEFGNSGSRTHEYGTRAKQAVQRAREQVAAVVKAKPDEVIFTSGATESNNIALLGLAEHGEKTGRKHLISTTIEHKAVLEPLEFLARHGFEVTLLPPTEGGWVESDAIKKALRKDTMLVSVMHANNETGVVQPLDEITEALIDHPAFLHVDAAQTFGKVIEPLKHTRIDLISVSGHKVYAPKGVGVLIARRRGFTRLPLQPLTFGGGQERGLRPGTLPVPLVAGIGLAAELALQHADERAAVCKAYRRDVLNALTPLNPDFNGDQTRMLPHTLNISFPGLDSEALMVALKPQIAISNGSACTSHSYQPSHVLQAMRIPTKRIQEAVRLSWCHMTEEVDWSEIARTIKRLAM
ncbi:MAG TPA: cysteine desulfurase DndA [Pyrinomonadaceae bacterium]|jgi:cysteine desulfurase